MKIHLRLKTLICLSLLIFAFPFLQTCSDESIKNLPFKEVMAEPVENNPGTNGDAAQKVINISKVEKEKKLAKIKALKELQLKEVKKEYTLNAYGFAYVALKEFDVEVLSDKFFYIYLNFPIIIFLTILMLVLAFKRKLGKVQFFSAINILLLLVATLSFYLTGVIEDLNQIKYGYYLFLLNSVLIILECRKVLASSRPPDC